MLGRDSARAICPRNQDDQGEKKLSNFFHKIITPSGRIKARSNETFDLTPDNLGELMHQRSSSRKVPMGYSAVIMRVLLIEDSKHLKKQVIKGLRASGYAVDEAADGEEGLWLAQSYDFDVIILDLMLPKVDGLTLLESLRNSGDETAVLILSAKDTVEDRVRGLRKGADDYLVKPFALEELLARIETLCRRTYEKRSSKVRVGDLELDSATKTATRAGQVLQLAPKQFGLLEYHMLRAGEVVSRTEIEEHIYDSNAAVMSNVIDSAVSSLRKATTVDSNSKPLIHTRRGHGYIVEESKD